MSLSDRLAAVRQVNANARASLFWALLSRQRRNVKWLFLLFLLSAVVNLFIANFTRGMVDRAIVDQAVPLWPFVRRVTPWILVGILTTFTPAFLTQRLAYQIEFDMRVWLYTHVQSAELRRLDAVAGGQLVTRALTDLQLLQRLLGVFPIIVGLAPLLLGILAFLVFLSPVMGVLTSLALPVNLWLVSRFKDRLRGLSWAELNERAEVMAAIDEPVRGIRVVKAFGREGHERRRVRAVTERAYRLSMSRVKLLARFDLPMKIVPYVVQGVVLLVGGHLVADDRLSLGTFLLAFQAGIIVIQIVTVFDELSSAWQYLRSAQDRLSEMLALGSKPVTEGRLLPEPSSGLQLENVGVDLGERVVLGDFELDIAPGRLTMVVGGPGSGKTTLAAVAAGLLVPARGRVLLDGVDLEELDPAEVRRAVRVVSEEPLLLAMSLRDNLRMGAPPDVDDEHILAALAAAGAEDVVADLPGGLDGLVGDRGLTLSGGQRQRLAVARALVAGPRLLVLDDALSAVNPSLELEVLRRIRRFAPSMSVLLVTRRGGAHLAADEVVTLRADGYGQVAAGHTTGGTAAYVDVELAKLVSEVELDEQLPVVPESAIEDETEPTLRSVLRPFRVAAALALLAVVLQALALSAPELLFGRVADVVEESTTTADRWAILLMGIGVVGGVTAYAFRILAQRFNQGAIYLLRRRTFHQLSRLGVDFYDRELPGQVAARVVHDLDTMLNFFQGEGFRLVTLLTRVLVAIGLIMLISSNTFPVVAVGVLVILVLTAVQLPFAMRAYSWSRDELGVVTAKFEEDFLARHEIRNLGAQALQTRKFVHASWERRRARWWTAVVVDSYAAVVTAMGHFLAVFVLWRAGDQVLSGELSIGTALTLQLLAVAGTQPLQQIGPLYGRLLEVRVSWNRLRQPFRVPVLPVVRPDAVPCPAIEGPVLFDGVGFAYPHTGRTVLDDVSFTLEPGKVTALVGYTGAGKSSIAKLVGRTYDPDRGKIVVDGIDLRDLDLDSFRSRIGIVPQDAFVFRGSVASNISYGRPGASVAEVEAVARAVGAHALLSALPDGFDHPVEEEGRNLTTAQRQVIALARAWMVEPDLLVLDEATSSLDGDVEQAVLDAVAALAVTTLMITHRESVAAAADVIVVLEAGRVVESGPAASVVAGSGAYARLWVSDEELVN